MDSMIYGSKEILNLFFNSFNSFIVWTDFEWTYDFSMAFVSFDCILANTQPTFCSEAGVSFYMEDISQMEKHKMGSKYD
jgi:hypothetical protein